MTLNH